MNFKKEFKKLGAITLSATMLASGLLPTIAGAHSPEKTTEISITNENNDLALYSETINLTTYSQSANEATTDNPTIQEFGFKGFLVKIAVKTIKTAVKSGGSILTYVTKWLDASTAKYLKNNVSKITKALDQLDNWLDNASDFTQSTIKTKLNSLLKAAGVPATYSLAIADAIARTVTFLLI